MRKSVYEYCEPWEVLFDIVLNHQDELLVHVGELVTVDRCFATSMRRVISKALRRTVDKIPYKFLGGELLTRCNSDVLPQFLIGKAFNEMPVENVEIMFPHLLRFQVDFIKSMNVEEGHYYSVNLESPEGSWDAVCDILSTCKGVPINVELKENAQLSPRAMQKLAKVCAQTNIRIYIDDLCTFCHRIPDQQDYIIMLIEILHPFIKCVKVDYDVMKKIRRDWTSFRLVRTNLEAFAWFWLNVTENKQLPYVVFESMPVEEIYWFDRFEELAMGYYLCGYQRG